MAARGVADLTDRSHPHGTGAALPERPGRGLRLRYRVPLAGLVVIGMLGAASYPGYRATMRDMRADVLAGSHIAGGPSALQFALRHPRIVALEGGGHVPVDHLEQITAEMHSFLADHAAVS